MSVSDLTPDLLTLVTWRPEQFDRVTNPGFEVDTTGWAGDSGGSIARVTTDAHSGVACLSVTAAGAGDGAVHSMTGTFFSQAYGARYVATFWARRFSGARRWAMELGDSGGDVATVELPDLSDAWRRYTVTWRPEPDLPSTDNLFLTPDGAPMTYGALRQALKRLGKKAGGPRLRAHLFRHTFAVRYLMNGGDGMTLRLLLGHSTLDVTQMYMHLAEAHIKVQHSRFSPVDRLGIGRGKRGR